MCESCVDLHVCVQSYRSLVIDSKNKTGSVGGSEGLNVSQACSERREDIWRSQVPGSVADPRMP